MKLLLNEALDEFSEAKNEGIITKPVIPGPFTFLNQEICRFKKDRNDYMDEVASCLVTALIKQFKTLALSGYSLTSRIFVRDLSTDDISFFSAL